MATCIFCNQQPGKWSAEHIVPQWLLGHLGITQQDQLFQGVAGTAEFDVKKDRVHGTWQFVEGRVCEPCNNTWMSRLETAATPAVTDLIEGRRGPHELSPEEVAIVAKWATKNAYLQANVSLAGKPVPPAHVQSLCTDAGVIPTGVGVFAYVSAYDRPISILQDAYWPQLILKNNAAPASVTPEDAYKIGVQYKHLYLVVAYWPQQPNALAIAAGVHIPLWPRLTLWPSYVNRNRIGYGQSLPVLKGLCDSITVVLD